MQILTFSSLLQSYLVHFSIFYLLNIRNGSKPKTIWVRREENCKIGVVVPVNQQSRDKSLTLCIKCSTHTPCRTSSIIVVKQVSYGLNSLKEL